MVIDRPSTREYVSSLNFILYDVHFGDHALAERTEPWRHELELDLEELILNDCGDKDLDFEVEHVIPRHRLAYLEEILLTTTIVIVNEEAARIPIIFRVIKHLELDESRLSRLNSSVIFIPFNTDLLRHVFNEGEVLDGSSPLSSEHTRDPGTPVVLLRDLRQLHVVLKPDSVLLSFAL